ncbi:MAG: DUF2061 domain-containing protein [Dehalococcoidia bacterium]
MTASFVTPSAAAAGVPRLDSRRRSIAKALSWRVVATLITGVVAWLLTGRLDIAVEIGMLDATLKLAVFYGHERLWQRAGLGRVRRPTDPTRSP